MRNARAWGIAAVVALGSACGGSVNTNTVLDEMRHRHDAGSGSADSGSGTPDAGSGMDAGSAGGLVISTALTLSSSTVVQGSTVTGTVTYSNTGSTAVTVQTIVIAGRPPNFVSGVGPYDDFSPASGALTLHAGASFTLTASRTISTSDPTGQWYSYATYQDSTGAWHDGPYVYFTVTAPSSSDAGSGGGSDAGTGGSDAGTSGSDAGTGASDAGTGGGDAGMSIRVSGNRLVDGTGTARQLRGVNRSGTEYACIQGWGIFDGPSDDASVQAIASWHATSVRVPINEDCWLGINGVNPAYGGANYQTAIIDYVNLLHKHGMYAELSLIWGAPGTTAATDQPDMPDTDHSITLWQSVAQTFKSDPAVIFGVFGEPHNVGWSCWINGGSSCSIGYSVAGMQSLVNAVRGTGATQVISVPGIDYANNLTSWLQYKPSDPLGQMIAEAHVYGGNTCDTTSCFDQQLAPVAQQVPMLWGETGEDYAGNDYGNTYISQFLPWADAHGVSYQGWDWDTWGGSLQLISNYNGAVNTASGYAVYFQSHLAALAGQP